MLIKFSKFIYRNTPLLVIRKFYFSIFSRLVKNKNIETNIDGLKFSLELGELIDLALYLGQFEPSVVRAINTYCQSGMVVFDIGANIGAHALRLADKVGGNGKVYAFEPTTFAFSKLERNIELNPNLNISAFRVALSNELHGNHEITYKSSWRTDGAHKDSKCNVDFIGIDEWARFNGVDHIDLVKIDIDGNEYSALASGIELIKRSRPIFIMELVGPHFSNANKNPFALLETMGYKFSNLDTNDIYSSCEAMHHLIPSDDIRMTTSMNILALPS
ncbi:FkbM family methyltransferase [Polynucleobacter paneuropaeus]|nr:FkbM family methyltransferase [Polynucleobacter paneuropaeus]